jgi:hypothetical protein
MVLLLGFGVLSDVGRVNDRTEAQRRVGQTTRFVVDKLAREIRLANGLLTVSPEGDIRQLATPFIFVGGSTDSQGRTVTSTINLNRTDFPSPYQAEPDTTRIALVGTGLDRYLELQACQDTSCSQITQRSRITPASLEVEQFEMVGVQQTQANPNRLPVVTIRLTLADRTLGQAGPLERIRQTVETTVTTRNLLERLP